MVTENDSDRLQSPQPKEVNLHKGNTTVVVELEGALVSRFIVDDTEVFYPEQIFIIGDKEKSRGGNPFLFPNAGSLPKGNKEFPHLKQHGFARDKEWEIKSHDPEKGAIILTLSSDEDTKRHFPYDFDAELRISIDEGQLRYDLIVLNDSDGPMPIAPGFHPYFHVPIEKREELKINIPSFDPRSYDWESSLILPRQEIVIADIPNSGTATIKSSPEFKRLVVWSEKVRPHLCIEPWVGDVNAILNPEERIEIQPGESANLWMEIQFQKA